MKLTLTLAILGIGFILVPMTSAGAAEAKQSAGEVAGSETTLTIVDAEGGG